MTGDEGNVNGSCINSSWDHSHVAVITTMTNPTAQMCLSPPLQLPLYSGETEARWTQSPLKVVQLVTQLSSSLGLTQKPLERFQENQAVF